MRERDGEKRESERGGGRYQNGAKIDWDGEKERASGERTPTDPRRENERWREKPERKERARGQEVDIGTQPNSKRTHAPNTVRTHTRAHTHLEAQLVPGNIFSQLRRVRGVKLNLKIKLPRPKPDLFGHPLLRTHPCQSPDRLVSVAQPKVVLL